MKNSKETLAKRNRLKREWFAKLKDTDFPKTIKKRCKDCGEIKDCKWQHSFTQTGVPEYRCRCIDCYKKYLSDLRKRRRLTLNRQRLARIEETKEKCIILLGGKCKDCGESDMRILSFHHKKPEQKEFDISKLINNGCCFSNKKLQDELKKCELLCFNCHMKRHIGKLNKRSENENN